MIIHMTLSVTVITGGLCTMVVLENAVHSQHMQLMSAAAGRPLSAAANCVNCIYVEVITYITTTAETCLLIKEQNHSSTHISTVLDLRILFTRETTNSTRKWCRSQHNADNPHENPLHSLFSLLAVH